MPEPLLEPSLLAAGVWLVLAGIVAVVLFITSYFVKTTDKSEWNCGNVFFILLTFVYAYVYVYFL